MLIPHADDLSPSSLARLLELDPCLEPEDLVQTLALADLMASHSPAGAAHREGSTWIHFGVAIRSARAEAGLTRGESPDGSEGGWRHHLGRRCRIEDVAERLVDDRPAPDSRFEHQAKLHALQGQLPRLAEREQYVLDAYYWQDLTVAEIHTRVGVLENRVSCILDCAVRLLRMRMSRAGW